MQGKTLILLVPDYGNAASVDFAEELKNNIEATGEYLAKIAEFPKIVEGDNEEKDSRLIELSARRLKYLSKCRGLMWGEGTDANSIRPVKIVRLKLDHSKFVPVKAEDKNENDDADTFAPSPCDLASLPVTDWVDAPDLVVVIGKSAMLTGNLDSKDVLFINPQYDSEWPWKKQYYADRDLAGEYMTEKYDYERVPYSTLHWSGSESKGYPRYHRRFGIATRGHSIHNFLERYPREGVVDDSLTDAQSVAKLICDFAHDKVSNPLVDIDRAMVRFPEQPNRYGDDICSFDEPVKLINYTILGLRRGIPMANGQSGLHLRVAESDYSIPLENCHTRSELAAICAAITRQRESLKEYEHKQKRVLIVPDILQASNHSVAEQLRRVLSDMNYDATIFNHGDSLEQSRDSIERRSKVCPFDLIISFGASCLLVARVTNCERIFVCPDWEAWQHMSRNRGLAQQMSKLYYIRRGDHPDHGWFAADSIDTPAACEHRRRFKTCTYLSDLSLTPEGTSALARLINNL